MQSPRQRGFTVPSPLNELPSQCGEAGAPTDGQAPSQLFLDLAHFVHEFSIRAHPTCAFTLRHGVHGTGEEEPDGLVDMVFLGDGRQCHLGEGLGDTDDGLQLTDSDGDGRAHVAVPLGASDAVADRDEVGRKFLCRRG